MNKMFLFDMRESVPEEYESELIQALLFLTGISQTLATDRFARIGADCPKKSVAICETPALRAGASARG